MCGGQVYTKGGRVYSYFRVGCPTCEKEIPLWIRTGHRDESCPHLMVDHKNTHGAVIEFHNEGSCVTLNVVDLLERVIPGSRGSGLDLSTESADFLQRLVLSWARAKALPAAFFRFDEASSEEAHVYSEQLGNLSLEGVSDSLEKMSLLEPEAIEGKLPGIIGEADLPDYEVARRQAEELGSNLAESLENDEVRMAHASTSQLAEARSTEDSSGPSDDEFLEALRALMPTTSEQPKLGVKALLKKLRESHSGWDIDSRRVRDGVQKLAPTRHCADCGSDQAVFCCTGCDDDSKPCVLSSCSNI